MIMGRPLGKSPAADAVRRASVLARSIACVGLALAAGAPALAGQSVSAPALKAAFLYNFAKFAEWPADAVVSGAPLVICVARDEAVGDALADIMKGRPSETGTLTVRRVPNDAWRGCHLIYISQLEPRRLTELLDLVRDLPILTVSDIVGFAEAGGVAQFFEESGKMRFAINTSAAERARLRLSSRLLSLAKIVKDGRNAVQH